MRRWRLLTRPCGSSSPSRCCARGEQLPLTIHLGLAAPGKTIESFVGAHVAEHRFDGDEPPCSCESIDARSAEVFLQPRSGAGESMSPVQHLFTACTTLVALTFIVGLRMFYVRVLEMRTRRIHPQSVALSAQRAQKLEDSRASDNYNHLFELPVVFYILCLVAMATGHIPAWLPALAWLFVSLRIVHSAIQCTYNKVMHRFSVFLAGFFLMFAMWVAYAVSYVAT